MNAAVECGNIEISTPWLLGKCCRWSAQDLARGCFNQISPFWLLLRGSSLQILQSSSKLNTTSYASPPSAVLFLIACLHVGL